MRLGHEVEAGFSILREGEEIEGTVSGSLAPAEPAAGISGPYAEDLRFVSSDGPEALTAREELAASRLLVRVATIAAEDAAAEC